MSTFSERLRSLRSEKELTRATLSNLIGISPSSLNMYERGEREPGIETLEQIADFFNVDMDYLIGRQEVQRVVDFSHLQHNDTSNLINVTEHERDVLFAYRSQPDMQAAIDRILGIEPKVYNLAQAARNQQPLILDEERAKAFADLADKAPDSSDNKDVF